MKTNKFMIMALAAVLLVGAAFVASATPVGSRVSLDKGLVDLFTAKGIDAQYLNVPAAQIPADVLAKINAVVNTPDMSAGVVATTVLAAVDETTDPYDIFTNLVNASLAAGITADYQPVYISLGSTVYQAEQGMNPENMTAAQIAANPTVLNYVPLN